IKPVDFHADPKSKPTENQKKIRDFLFTCEERARTAQYRRDPTEKTDYLGHPTYVDFAALGLRGHALDKWQELTEGERTSMTWNDFRRWLRTTFESPLALSTAIRQFRDCKQRGSVRDYNVEFNKCVDTVKSAGGASFAADDAVLAQYYRDGLKITLQQIPMIQDQSLSLHELQVEADKLDQINYRFQLNRDRQNFRPQQRSSFQSHQQNNNSQRGNNTSNGNGPTPMELGNIQTDRPRKSTAVKTSAPSVVNKATPSNAALIPTVVHGPATTPNKATTTTTITTTEQPVASITWNNKRTNRTTLQDNKSTTTSTSPPTMLKVNSFRFNPKASTVGPVTNLKTDHLQETKAENSTTPLDRTPSASVSVESAGSPSITAAVSAVSVAAAAPSQAELHVLKLRHQQEIAVNRTSTDSLTEDEELLIVNGTLYGHKVRILIDGGATSCFIDSKLVDYLNLHDKIDSELAVNIRLANGDTCQGKTLRDQPIRVRQNSKTYKDKLDLVMAPICYDIILGKNWLRRVNPQIDWQTNVLKFSKYIWNCSLPSPTPLITEMSATALKRAIRKKDVEVLLLFVRFCGSTEELINSVNIVKTTADADALDEQVKAKLPQE
ncbi:hypothetical protein HDU76_010026, partial [Blyttiomyces sp. JEL0837]